MELSKGNVLRESQALRLNNSSETKQIKSPIEVLPKELLDTVVKHLSAGEVVKLSATNTTIHTSLRANYQSLKLESKAKRVNSLERFKNVLEGVKNLEKFLQVKPALTLATRIPVLPMNMRSTAKEALNALLEKHSVGSDGREELERQKLSDNLKNSVQRIIDRDSFKNKLAEITTQSRSDLQVEPLLALRSKIIGSVLFSNNEVKLFNEAVAKLPEEYRQANVNLMILNRPNLHEVVAQQVMQTSAAQASARIAGLQAEQIIRRTEPNVVTNLQDRIVLSRSLPENFHEIRNSLSRENRERLDFVQNLVALERQNYISLPDSVRLADLRTQAGERNLHANTAMRRAEIDRLLHRIT